MTKEKKLENKIQTPHIYFQTIYPFEFSIPKQHI